MKEEITATSGRSVSPNGPSREHLSINALLEADRCKDDFLAVVGHELRNALSSIRTAVLLIRRADAADPSRPLDVIERQVASLSNLADDLMDAASIRVGKWTPRIEETSIQQILQLALETSMPLIQAQGHRLSVVLPPTAVPIKGDRAKLARVFANLLNNAAKYTHSGGTITVEAARIVDRVRVKVADTGIGIPADAIPTLFDMFMQGPSKANNQTRGGLGIGLPVVRKLVELHGGTVVARSLGVGRGSEFIVLLPRATNHNETSTDSFAGCRTQGS